MDIWLGYDFKKKRFLVKVSYSINCKSKVYKSKSGICKKEGKIFAKI